MCRADFWTQGEGEGGMIWENGIETYILSGKKQIASLISIVWGKTIGAFILPSGRV